MRPPWYPTSGASSPSSLANRIALETIRPVTRVTTTPRRRAALTAARVSGPMIRSSPDERPVDIEGDQADGQDRRRREGHGHPVMMTDRGGPRPRRAGDALRSRLIRPPAAARRDRARPSRTNRAEERDRGDDVLALVGADLEQRLAIGREHVRQPHEQPADDLETIARRRRGPVTGSNDVATGRCAIASCRTYGRFARTRS